MARTVTALLAPAAVHVLAGAALAHGGQYRAPGFPPKPGTRAVAGPAESAGSTAAGSAAATSWESWWERNKWPVLGLVVDRGLDERIRSHVPTALARLACRPDAFDPSVVPALLAAFGRRHAKPSVRQSVAVALGRIGTVTGEAAEDDHVVRVLL
jgi:hypothetical protein